MVAARGSRRQRQGEERLISDGRPAARAIGVFTAGLDDSYQVAVWRGMEQRARELGVGIVCFLGSRVRSPVAWESAANVAYRIPDRGSIEGLIVVTSAIATFLDAEALARLFRREDRLPQVSVGAKISGVVSLSVDGTQAIGEIVRHLVRDHGRRRFALIDGPAGHPEGEQRARAVRQALAAAGIDFDDRLSVVGTFMQESGAEGVRKLIELGIGFDALICLNDRMALGALPVLEASGKRVGEEVSVVGFDGIEAGRYVTPPLTTVVQPLKELGRRAVDALLELLEGREGVDRRLSCVPEVRQSCGCPPARSYDPECSEIPDDATAEERAAVQELTDLAREGDNRRFILRLNRSLSDSIASDAGAIRWNDILSVVRSQLAESAEVQRLIEFSRVLVGEVESRAQAKRRTASIERSAALLEISASLAASFELPVMLARLESGLERLAVGAGYLALFEATTPEWSRLVLHPEQVGERRSSPGPGSGRPSGAKANRFETSSLLPPSEGDGWRGRSWVLEPLVFQSEALGYLLLPGGAADPAVYDTLRKQVSSAIKGALLLEQVRTHEHRLEAEVRRRTSELTRTNIELRREIEGRVRLEDEVVDISNRTMQRIGQDIHDDLCQHLAGIAMFVTALREKLDADKTETAAVDHIGDLLADSIARAKQIARGLFPTGLEEDGLSAAIGELVATVRQRFSATIDFRTSPDFVLGDTDRALQVYRIVQEALSNALMHSGSDRVEVRLRRERWPEGQSSGRNDTGESNLAACLVAEVIDYGVGLPTELPSEGMGLRIMRYRAEKADIKLTIDSGGRGTTVSCRFE